MRTLSIIFFSLLSFSAAARTIECSSTTATDYVDVREYLSIDLRAKRFVAGVESVGNSTPSLTGEVLSTRYDRQQATFTVRLRSDAGVGLRVTINRRKYAVVKTLGNSRIKVGPFRYCSGVSANLADLY